MIKKNKFVPLIKRKKSERQLDFRKQRRTIAEILKITKFHDELKENGIQLLLIFNIKKIYKINIQERDL